MVTLSSYPTTQDWKTPGLALPSTFRAYLATVPAKEVKAVGRLTNQDWKEIQKRLGLALAALTPAQLQAEQSTAQAKQERDAALQRAETAESRLAQEQAEKEKLLAKLKDLGSDPDQI